jgi:uncharacterized protein (TIGR02246 family)
MNTPETSDPADIAAIRQVVEDWDHTFAEANADVSAPDFADDALWINAFGVIKHGRQEIHAFLGSIFDRPGRGGFEAVHVTGSEPWVRFVRPDVAVVHSRSWFSGQRSASGQEYPERRIHYLRILTKEQGRWAIAAQMVMDEKDPLP